AHHPELSGIIPEHCPPCHRNAVRHPSGIPSVMGRCTHVQSSLYHRLLQRCKQRLEVLRAAVRLHQLVNDFLLDLLLGHTFLRHSWYDPTHKKSDRPMRTFRPSWPAIRSPPPAVPSGPCRRSRSTPPRTARRCTASKPCYRICPRSCATPASPVAHAPTRFPCRWSRRPARANTERSSCRKRSLCRH